MLVFHPEDLFRPRGLLLLLSIPFLIVGLMFYAFAGRRREKEQADPNAGPSPPKSSFATGMALCIFTGIFGSSYNLGFAFGGDVIRASLRHGAGPLTSTYAVWSLVLGAGFIPNLVYCVYLLVKNRTGKLFAVRGWPREAAAGHRHGPHLGYRRSELRDRSHAGGRLRNIHRLHAVHRREHPLCQCLRTDGRRVEGRERPDEKVAVRGRRFHRHRGCSAQFGRIVLKTEKHGGETGRPFTHRRSGSAPYRAGLNRTVSSARHSSGGNLPSGACERSARTSIPVTALERLSTV